MKKQVYGSYDLSSYSLKNAKDLTDLKFKAAEDYVQNRYNCVDARASSLQELIGRGFPMDGESRYSKSNPQIYYYFEGINDKKWMQKQDQEYLKQLKRSKMIKEREPDLWKRLCVLQDAIEGAKESLELLQEAGKKAGFSIPHELQSFDSVTQQFKYYRNEEEIEKDSSTVQKHIKEFESLAKLFKKIKVLNDEVEQFLLSTKQRCKDAQQSIPQEWQDFESFVSEFKKQPWEEAILSKTFEEIQQRLLKLRSPLNQVISLVKAVNMEGFRSTGSAVTLAQPIDSHKVFDFVVNLVSPNAKFKVDDEVSIKYLPHLASKSGINFTGFILDSKSENTTLKDLLFNKQGTELEGWNEQIYLFLRSVYLLKYIAEWELNLISGDKISTLCGAKDKLYEELAVTIEAARNFFIALKISQPNAPILEQLVNEIIRNISWLTDEQEYVLAAGGSGKDGAHAIYVAFHRRGDEILIRVYNRGYGIDKPEFGHHCYKDQQSKDKVRPALLGRFDISLFVNKDPGLINYLGGIIDSAIKFQPKDLDTILADGAYNITALGPPPSLQTSFDQDFISRKIQKVGNCVVQSWEFGVLYRLISKQGNKSLYKLQKQSERHFAADFESFLKQWRKEKKQRGTPTFFDSFVGAQYGYDSETPKKLILLELKEIFEYVLDTQFENLEGEQVLKILCFMEQLSNIIRSGIKSETSELNRILVKIRGVFEELSKLPHISQGTCSRAQNLVINLLSREEPKTREHTSHPVQSRHAHFKGFYLNPPRDALRVREYDRREYGSVVEKHDSSSEDEGALTSFSS